MILLEWNEYWIWAEFMGIMSCLGFLVDQQIKKYTINYKYRTPSSFCP